MPIISYQRVIGDGLRSHAALLQRSCDWRYERPRVGEPRPSDVGCPVPFKANADRRHRIPRQRFKVTNWREYDASLRGRGSLTVWFTEEEEGVTASIGSRHPDAAIIVPPRSTAVPSEAAETAPTQRDRHLRAIAEHGRMAWQAASGYTKRARAETAMSRLERVIGDGLRSHTDECRATEVEVAVHALNRMLDLGRPNSVRIA